MREMSYILKLTEGYTITNGAGLIIMAVRMNLILILG